MREQESRYLLSWLFEGLWQIVKVVVCLGTDRADRVDWSSVGRIGSGVCRIDSRVGGICCVGGSVG